MSSPSKVQRWRLRQGVDPGELIPRDARIEVEPVGRAFLVLGGVRAIRADGLGELLALVRLDASDLEREPTG